ncbi:hypothetical protein [Alkalihalobacterium elongatum]|uniref:hypothetical protein n=1 Tax=Alkalihalobacterium elongatum TaxID=2675466 RepID=UPI001C1F4E25|nr:hypothetical protein [Alkalihalobacterium elongatum]
MKKSILLIISSFSCIAVWTAVLFTLLKPSIAVEQSEVIDYLVFENAQVLVDEEPSPQVVESKKWIGEKGITLQEAKQLTPNQEISIDELLDMMNKEEADR